MKNPMAYVHNENNAKQEKWPIIFFFPRGFWVKGAPSFRKHLQTKIATAVAARVFTFCLSSGALNCTLTCVEIVLAVLKRFLWGRAARGKRAEKCDDYSINYT